MPAEIQKYAHYVPKIMVSNVRSLVLKIVEVHEFLNRNQISIAFITESWLRSSTTESVDIDRFSFIQKDK